MTPISKTILSILCSIVATHCWAEDNILPQAKVPKPLKPALEIYISSPEKGVSELVNLGLQEYLLQNREGALHYFQQALQADSDCFFAHLGMLLVIPSRTPVFRQHLGELNLLIDRVGLTPVEEWYFSSFLQLINGDLDGAAKSFQHHAATFRRDTMAAAWDIILSHYALEQGESIISRADKLLERQPDNPMAHYCRAFVEEYRNPPSEKALKCAQKAADMMSAHPAVQLLEGHLLRASGQSEAAIRAFKAVSSCQYPELRYTALLSIPSLQWASSRPKDQRQALLAARKAAESVPSTNPETDAETLIHWEGSTLLLRMLVQQQSAPGSRAISMAASLCNPQPDSLLDLTKQCLIAAIQTRALADTGQLAKAGQYLEKSRNLLDRIEREGELQAARNAMQRCCYQRALKACRGAILRAQTALYTDSRDIWQTKLDELLNAPDSRFLPPVLPKQGS